jgi:AraC-like DNA-binding protein
MAEQYYNPEINLLMGRFQHLVDWNISDLTAPYWRFYWNSSDSAYVNFAGKQIRFSPALVYLIPPETEFSSRNDMAFDQFYIHFQTAPPYDSCRPGIYSFELNEDMDRLITVTRQMMRSESSHDRLASMHLLTICHRALLLLPEDVIGNEIRDQRIRKAANYIEKHSGKQIRNQKLASLAGMNTNSFINLFRQQTGDTPQQFLLKKRIQKACICLRYTDMTIEDIALATGFYDRYHFSKAFKNIRGDSPAVFRKKIL